MGESKQTPHMVGRGNDSFSVPLAVEDSSGGSGGYHQIEGHGCVAVYCAMPFLQCCAARARAEGETIGRAYVAHWCGVGTTVV